MFVAQLRKYRFFQSSAVLGLIFVTVAGVAAAGQFSKGPYIQFPAPGVVTVMWESLTNHPGIARLASEGNPERVLEPVVPVERESQTSGTAKSTNAVFYLYKATFPGLQPGGKYGYTVEVNGERSAERQFRTLDPAAPDVRFIVYGDSRSDPKTHTALTRQFARHAPEFIMHTGDLVGKGRDYSQWSKEFFNPTADVIDRIPFFSVIGNHEEDGTNYLNYFDLPGNRLWYSFDAGPVHALALDFRSEKRSGEQYQFAREDLLQSRAPWKLVVLHTPVFNIGGHASAWGHADYLPLFHEAKVDLVLSGHSHMYERFRPLAPAKSKDKWCITHITTGGGGANLHTALAHPALVTQETTNHFMVFEAGPQTLRGTAIRVDGTVIDSFELTKQAGKMSRDYLARAYTEESLNLFYETAPLLAARVDTVPTATVPAEVQFKLPSRGRSASIARLEIRLTPEAARYYQLVQGPLKVSTPRFGHTNVVVAKILATGATPIAENKSKELTPTLAFQARVKAAEGETLSYGASARVGKLETPTGRQTRMNTPLRSPKAATVLTE